MDMDYYRYNNHMLLLRRFRRGRLRLEKLKSIAAIINLQINTLIGPRPIKVLIETSNTACLFQTDGIPLQNTISFLQDNKSQLPNCPDSFLLQD